MKSSTEAMQWLDPNPDDNPENGATWHDAAMWIVEWVKANGGEAQYVQAGVLSPPHGRSSRPRIAVRTINGWAYATPGHYVVMGTAQFTYAVDPDYDGVRDCLDFYPCAPVPVALG